MADQTLTCQDCGATFTFTESEQEFYQSKGFSTPGRCPSCRARPQGGPQRRWHSRWEHYGSGGGYGGERQMYPAVCASAASRPKFRSSPVATARSTALTATQPSVARRPLRQAAAAATKS